MSLSKFVIQPLDCKFYVIFFVCKLVKYITFLPSVGLQGKLMAIQTASNDGTHRDAGFWEDLLETGM